MDVKYIYSYKNVKISLDMNQMSIGIKNLLSACFFQLSLFE